MPYPVFLPVSNDRGVHHSDSESEIIPTESKGSLAGRAPSLHYLARTKEDRGEARARVSRETELLVEATTES